MAPTTSHMVLRHSSLKLVACSSSPGDKQYWGIPGHTAQHRTGHLSAAHAFTAGRGSYCSGHTPTGFKLLAALPDPSAAATATSTPQTAATSSPMITAVDSETLRLVTAATILSHSDSESDTDTAEAFSSLSKDSSTLTHPLSYLDELTTLNADSLALAIGILRQQQPVNIQDADVQLSERLLDLLVLLHHRPGSLFSSRSSSCSASPALGSSPSSSDGFTAAEEDGFWSTGDDWSDVRCALMSIGINASLEEEDDDDDEDVWTLEEEGPARRTHLLKSLPRLTPDTAQQLADFLAMLQQQRADAASSATDADSRVQANSSNGHAATADHQELSDEDERWWDQVTEAYELLWKQARLQQAK